MNKEFIPYKLALKLKELGFEEPCFGYWKMSDWLIEEKTRTDGYTHADQLCSAPLYQQVVEWLRQKGIIIELIVDGWGDDNCVNEEYLCYRIFIWQIGKPKPHHNDDLGALATPQEAYSDAFDYILNIKNRFFAKSTEK
jgi:hypothetical protein